MDLPDLVDTPLDVWCKLIDIQFLTVICQRYCSGSLPHSPVCVYWSTRNATNGVCHSKRCETSVAATTQTDCYTICDSYSELHYTESYSAVQTETVYSDFCCDGKMVYAFEVQMMIEPSLISTLEQETTQDIQFVHNDISHATAKMSISEMPVLHNAITSEQNLWFNYSAPADSLLLDIPLSNKKQLLDNVMAMPQGYQYNLCVCMYRIITSMAVTGISNLHDQSKVFDPGILLL